MKRIFQLVLMVLLVSIPFTACSTKTMNIILLIQSTVIRKKWMGKVIGLVYIGLGLRVALQTQK